MHQDISDIFEMETKLFPVLVDMRFLGVRVDKDQAYREKKLMLHEENQLLGCVC